MGVAVLSPESCLRDSFNHPKPRRSSGINRSGRRKPQRSPSGSPPPQSGQFRILKRGEDLTPTKPPVKNQKAKREGSVPAPGPITRFYAGSAFFTSPPPSSVPLPAFCVKNIGAGAGGLTKSSAEDATFDLRRILRLE